MQPNELWPNKCASNIPEADGEVHGDMLLSSALFSWMSKTFDDHLLRLEAVLKEIIRTQFKTHASLQHVNCLSLQSHTGILGHFVGEHGISADPVNYRNTGKPLRTSKNYEHF